MGTEPRRTRQRGVMWAYVSDMSEFQTAQRIYDRLRDRGTPVSLPTVYRTLAAWAGSGDLDHITTDGQIAYRRCSADHHHHLVCRSCGRTIELKDTPVEAWAALVAQKYGFTDITHVTEITGLCPTCQHARSAHDSMIDQALDFLDDRVFYADMIGLVTRGESIIAAGPTGVLVQNSDGTYMMASADEQSARNLLDLIDPDHCDCIVVHEDSTIGLVEQRFGFDRHTRCIASAYLGDPLPQSERTDIRVQPLTPQWVDLVSENYNLDGPDYIRTRIDAGEMWGAFHGNDLTGFIGLHEEGSMGMLVVLDQYRRHGIAEYLVIDLANRMIAQSLTPHDHIIVGNLASEALQRKLGFSISTRTLTWMSRGNRGPSSQA